MKTLLLLSKTISLKLQSVKDQQANKWKNKDKV